MFLPDEILSAILDLLWPKLLVSIGRAAISAPPPSVPTLIVDGTPWRLRRHEPRPLEETGDLVPAEGGDRHHLSKRVEDIAGQRGCPGSRAAVDRYETIPPHGLPSALAEAGLARDPEARGGPKKTWGERMYQVPLSSSKIATWFRSHTAIR